MIQFDEHIFEMGWNHKVVPNGAITLINDRTYTGNWGEISLLIIGVIYNSIYNWFSGAHRKHQQEYPSESHLPNAQVNLTWIILATWRTIIIPMEWNG